MTAEVWKEFSFEAAHWLPNVPDWHKCKRLHGHHYVVRLTVRGPIDPVLGWVQDYGDIAKAFEPWLFVFDHNCLNDIAGLENSTAENLAVFILDRMRLALPMLYSVTVNEVPGTGVVVYGGVAEVRAGVTGGEGR